MALTVIFFALTLCVPRIFSAPVAVFHVGQDIPVLFAPGGGIAPILPAATTSIVPSSSVPRPSSSASIRSTAVVPVTKVVVVTVYPSSTPSPTPTTTTVVVTQTPTPTPAPSPPLASWSIPAFYTDLAPFSITKIPNNLQIVTGLPASATTGASPTPVPPPAEPVVVGDPTVVAPIEGVEEGLGEVVGLENVVESALMPIASAAAVDPLNALGGLVRKDEQGQWPMLFEDTATVAPGYVAPAWDNTTSVIQTFYPEGSINPGQQPVGGAQFYGTPIATEWAGAGPDGTTRYAQNVTLEYSVFFPFDFEFVKGGKLPGLYGGKKSCSGGNDATQCFSTRLMWRNDGMGETYLYAPKDRQTSDFCSSPQSHCDAAYGLSVGRGSFYFRRGAWTHIVQTIVLNTPGEQNGYLSLDINGKRVTERGDVFYRDVAPPPEPIEVEEPETEDGNGDDSSTSYGDDANAQSVASDKTPKNPTSKPKKPTTTPQAQPEATPSPEASNDGLVDGLLGGGGGGLLGGLFGRELDVLPGGEAPLLLSPSSLDPLIDVASPLLGAQAGMSDPRPVGFTGVFFSTFFGGHEQKYATPKDQYTWYKDFKVVVNA